MVESSNAPKEFESAVKAFTDAQVLEFDKLKTKLPAE